MKRLVEELDGEGLEGLIGKEVALWCLNYIYAGKLVGVSETDAKLENPKVVYETGPLKGDSWQDAQELRSPHYVRVSAIESYGEVDHA